MKQTNKKWKKCIKCGGRIYDHRKETHECVLKEESSIKIKSKNVDEQTGKKKEKQSTVGTQKKTIQEQEKKKKKKGTMTITETKLGVTIVLSKEDCKKLEFKSNTTTKEVIKWVRDKLGLTKIKKYSKN